MKSVFRGAAIVAALSFWGVTAQAAPITWFIETGASSVQVSVPLLGASSDPANLDGTVTGDFTPDTSISANGGSVAILGDVVIDFNPFLEAVITGTGLGGTLTGPATPIVGGVADLQGWILTLNQGTLESVELDLLVDLSVDPFDFELPETLSTLTALGGGLYEWAIPVDAMTELDASAIFPGLFIAITISGDIVLTNVPEPGTALILLTGLTALAVRRRAC